MAVTIDGTANTITAEATSAANAIGINQTWQSFTTSGGSPQRTTGTTYTNSTGRPIMIAFSCNSGGASPTITIDSVTWTIGSGSSQYFNQATFSGVIPSGSTYSVSSFGSGSVTWAELR